MRNVQKEFNTMSGSMRVFDTLSYTKKLRQAGFSERQAEAQAETFLAIVQDHLATKEDMRALGAELELKIKESEASLRHDMREIEVSLKRDMKELEQKIKELEVSLRHDMKELEVSLRHDMKELEVSLKQELALIQHDMKMMEMKTTEQIKAMEVTIKTLEVSLTQKMEGMKKDLKIWLGGGLMAATTLILSGIGTVIALVALH